MTDDERKAEGLRIATRLGLKAGPEGWYVHSRSTPHSHFVRQKPKGGMTCTCLDYEARNLACAHIYAVLYFLQSEKPAATDFAPPRHRRTYPQDWHSYNTFQINEKALLPSLLSELCHLVIGDQREEPRRGRPAIPLVDALISAALKVGSDKSARTAMSGLRQVQDQGIIGRLPSYNAILATIADESLTPIIEKLVAESCRPLKAIESEFAIDSTGFGLRQYYRHYSEKRKAYSRTEGFIKLHVSVGTKTHIIAAVQITPGNVNDAMEFKPLVESTAEMFTLSEISADKAYLSGKALDLVESMGAAPYIAFKKNSVERPSSKSWTRLFHLYHLKREEFQAHYNKRSNVEAAFSSLKRRFTDFIRAKTFPAQKNELLLKVLVYNIGCVIKSMYELGIDPSFQSQAPVAGQAHRKRGWNIV